ncbi:MAG: hypothetical protein WBB28_24935 [Crinalium sp.]
MDATSNYWNLLGIVISICNDDDLEDLMAREHQASIAIQQLVSGELDIDTFGDILEDSGLDMDEYLSGVANRINA